LVAARDAPNPPDQKSDSDARETRRARFEPFSPRRGLAPELSPSAARDCIPGHCGHPYRASEGWDDVPRESERLQGKTQRLRTRGPTPSLIRAEASVFMSPISKARRRSAYNICLQRRSGFRDGLAAYGVLSAAPPCHGDRCTHPGQPPIPSSITLRASGMATEPS